MIGIADIRCCSTEGRARFTVPFAEGWAVRRGPGAAVNLFPAPHGMANKAARGCCCVGKGPRPTMGRSIWAWLLRSVRPGATVSNEGSLGHRRQKNEGRPLPGPRGRLPRSMSADDCVGTPNPSRAPGTGCVKTCAFSTAAGVDRTTGGGGRWTAGEHLRCEGPKDVEDRHSAATGKVRATSFSPFSLRIGGGPGFGPRGVEKTPGAAHRVLDVFTSAPLEPIRNSR